MAIRISDMTYGTIIAHLALRWKQRGPCFQEISFWQSGEFTRIFSLESHDIPYPIVHIINVYFSLIFPSGSMFVYIYKVCISNKKIVDKTMEHK